MRVNRKRTMTRKGMGLEFFFSSWSDCTPAESMDRYPRFFWRELEDVMAKKTTRLDKAMGKGEILAELAASTELPKKDVGRVLDELTALIERHIAKRSVGTFVLPGLLGQSRPDTGPSGQKRRPK